MENKFFGSKLNSVLLLMLIILMVATIVFMYKNKEIYLQTFFPNNQAVTGVPVTSPVDNTLHNKLVENWKEYKNDEIGISFKYPPNCGEIKSSVGNSELLFQAGPENIKDCPIKAIFGASPLYVDEVGECPIIMDFTEGNKEYAEDEKNYVNENGVYFLLNANYYELTPVCLPDFGEMSARINLKHTIPGIMIDGDMSMEFREILDSVKTY